MFTFEAKGPQDLTVILASEEGGDGIRIVFGNRGNKNSAISPSAESWEHLLEVTVN